MRKNSKHGSVCGFNKMVLAQHFFGEQFAEAGEKVQHSLTPATESVQEERCDYCSLFLIGES
jgi:hypothetical protein